MNKEEIGKGLKVDTGEEVWQGNEIGVNSEVPLMDEGKGLPYILRQFEFSFDPLKLKQMNEKKIPVPSKQQLFDSVWGLIRIELWKDGIVAIEDPLSPPRVITYKKHFKVILLCEPRQGNLVNSHIHTLQEITKPKKSLT